MGAELFHTDNEIRYDEFNSRFFDIFAKAPNKNEAKSVQSSNKLSLKGL